MIHEADRRKYFNHSGFPHSTCSLPFPRKFCCKGLHYTTLDRVSNYISRAFWRSWRRNGRLALLVLDWKHAALPRVFSAEPKAAGKAHVPTSTKMARNMIVPKIPTPGGGGTRACMREWRSSEMRAHRELIDTHQELPHGI